MSKQTKKEQEQALELAQTLQELFDICEKKLEKKWMKRSKKDLEKALNESDEISKIKFPDFMAGYINSQETENEITETEMIEINGSTFSEISIALLEQVMGRIDIFDEYLGRE